MALRMCFVLLFLFAVVTFTIIPAHARRSLINVATVAAHDDTIVAASPATAPEEEPKQNTITFFLQLHPSSPSATVEGGANNLNGIGTNGAINVNGGLNPQPLTFPAASLPNNNNNGLALGGAGLLINNGGGTIGGGDLVTGQNGIGGFINAGNGALGGVVGQLGSGILPNNPAATGLPLRSGEAAVAYPEIMTVEEPVYEDPEQESTVIGMAQGYYVPTLQHEGEVEGHGMFIAFTATFTHFAGVEIPSSIQLAGELKSFEQVGIGEGEMSVVGGTGEFHEATGHAMVQPMPEHHGLLKFTVSLS